MEHQLIFYQPSYYKRHLKEKVKPEHLHPALVSLLSRSYESFDGDQDHEMTGLEDTQSDCRI